MKCGKTALSSRAKQVWAAALLSVMATIAKAQDGAAGISEADSQVRSYFEPGTQLMYAIGAVLGLVGAVKVLCAVNCVVA